MAILSKAINCLLKISYSSLIELNREFSCDFMGENPYVLYGDDEVEYDIRHALIV